LGRGGRGRRAAGRAAGRRARRHLGERQPGRSDANDRFVSHEHRRRKLVASPEVATLKSEYKGSTWDVGSYRVSFVDGDKKPHTIVTSMLAFGQLPALLQQLMSEARKLAKDLYRRP
jgi:hypothetical protein